MQNSSPRLCAWKTAGRKQTPCARSSGDATPGHCQTRTSCWKITASYGVSRVFCGAGVTKVKRCCRTIPRRIIASRSVAVLPRRRNLETRWRNGAKPFARFTKKFLKQRHQDARKKTGSGKTVGNTRLRRVQFGVPPNCRSARMFAGDRISDNNLCSQVVSGVTPETTRGTRVLPYYCCVVMLLCFKPFSADAQSRKEKPPPPRPRSMNPLWAAWEWPLLRRKPQARVRKCRRPRYRRRCSNRRKNPPATDIFCLCSDARQGNGCRGREVPSDTPQVSNPWCAVWW